MTVRHQGQDEPAGESGAGRRELLAERLAASGTRIYPASAAQRRLWFEDQLRPGRTDYTVVWPLRLTGPLDPAALRTALTALVARHEVLRTRLVGVDGEPVQVVDPAGAVPCPLTDLTGLTGDARGARVRDRVRSAGTTPFDLAAGPLFLAELLREDERRHVLVLAAHHAVFDGWSWSVLLRDLSALYEDLTAGGDGTASGPSAVGYGDGEGTASGPSAVGYGGGEGAAAGPSAVGYGDGEGTASGPSAVGYGGGEGAAAGALSVRQGDEGAALEPLPVQYGDYAAWERELLSGEHLTDLLDFWRDQLTGAPVTTDLPVDFAPGPEGRSGAGARRAVAVPAAVAGALAELCAAERATPFMGVLAAVGLVLGRYGATDDVVVATLSANRTQPELEDLVGFFVNTLPLRIDLSGGPGFRELLARCRTAALGAFAHQDLPFDRVVEELAPRRARGVTPYARVALVTQNGPDDGSALGALAVESLPVETRTATFDLSMHLWPGDDGGLDGFVEYATDVFGADTAARFAGHVRHVLEQAVADPDRPVDAYALLTEDERRTAPADGGAGPAPSPADLLHTLVAAQAARTPDATAVSCGDESLTYAELDRAADGLAARLRASGVGVERLVGVCVRRSVRSVVALLGVLKAGAAYLPLEPDNPADRLAYVLADSGADTVVVESELLDRLPSGGFRAVLLDEVPAAPSVPVPPSGVRPENLAYVIYTSGSTGRPKGVAVSHRAAVTRVRDPRFVRLTERDVMLHALALSFDVSVLEVFGALTNGCRLAVLPGKAMPEAVGAFLPEQGVTVGWLTAALFHAVVDTAGAGLAGLRTLIAGGDQLSTSHVERALGLLDDRAVLVNGYGPTEAAIFASTHPMRPGDPVETRVPIGAPIPDTELFVLDDRFQLLPPGVPGELYIGGDCLARGYLGRPELTAERFLPNPYGTGGTRLYRTGDLVRRRSDGLLEFLGRTDHQVKVRGFRVELGEIEQVLRRHPAVGEAVVVAFADDRAEQTLVGYVEALPDGPPHPAELREHCRRSLPDYMVPARLVVLASLPLNPNGKVDRAALPDPAGARPELDTGYVPARTPVEESVAAVWREVLGLDRIGVHDDFFDLGGHSLLASRLLARLRRDIDRDLPLATLFAGPTVAALAAALESGNTGAARPGPLPGRRPDPLPASLGQRRLWFAHQLDPDSVDYTIVWPLRLLGPLDVPALRRAVDGVVARHEVLRTRFTGVAGEPVQIIDPAGAVPCPLTDLGKLPGDRRAAEVGARIATAAARRFDLATDAVFRAELLKVSATEHILLITVHHIVFDGWSASVLLRDLAALYEAVRAGGERGGPPPLALQYGDYAVWERDGLTGPVLTRQLDFWRDQLAGAPEITRLPADFVPAGPGRSGAGARHEVSVPAAPGAELAALCARLGATPFMGLLAAVGVVLGRYGETDDVVVGTYAANRAVPELEDLVGFFVNTLALRVDLSGDPTFRELVARCRSVSLDAFAHQDVPFDRVVEELAPNRRAGETPYVQVALVMQNVPADGGGPGALGDLRVESLPSDSASATFDLSLHVWPGDDGGLDGYVEYATDVFTDRTAARFADHVRRVLEQALADPDRPVGRHTVLTPVEHHALITAPGDRAEPYADGGPGARFLRQAARTPDAVAFVADGESVTYAELERRSGALAATLRAAGVGPETPVGVRLPRGLGLPVAALAVWRAGGAYLPLDPEAPASRIAHLIADSGTRLVLTDPAGAELLPAAVDHLVLDAMGEWPGPDRADVAGKRPGPDRGDAAGEWPTPDRADAAGKRPALDRADAAGKRPAPDRADAAGEWPGPERAGTTAGEGADIDALAAVIYTSGSTGLPKGVAITGRSLLNRIDWMADTWPFRPEDVLCQKGPIGFVDGLWELLGGLLHGVPTVIAPPEAGTDPRLLTELLAAHRVTRLLVVPSLLQALLEIPDLAAKLPALTRWVSSGEELPPTLARSFADRLPGRELRNLYGSSEVWDALCQRADGEPVAGRPVPVGDPISRITAYLLDRELRPVPVGVTGDLYLAGAGVARGYLGRPDLTAERFVPDPFDPAGGRVYRSGDRAVRRADGQIELAGRADLQLKIRGIRVEPAETERALEELPGVRQAVVTGRRGLGAPDGAMELIAHVVPEPGTPWDDRALRAELTRTLPRYLVPAVLVPLDELPLNTSGKVDRAALPAPRPRTTAPQAEDATGPERAMRAIWAELLGVDTVGVHEDFFDLGGHSLLAMQLVDRIAQSLGTSLGVRTVFENPTVHLLSRLLPTERGTRWRADV